MQHCLCVIIYSRCGITIVMDLFFVMNNVTVVQFKVSLVEYLIE
jgi:hypothetical protein